MGRELLNSGYTAEMRRVLWQRRLTPYQVKNPVEMVYLT